MSKHFRQASDREVMHFVRLREGETLALLGPNGAGKTTLIRAMNRTVPVSERRDPCLDGKEIAELSRREIAATYRGCRAGKRNQVSASPSSSLFSPVDLFMEAPLDGKPTAISKPLGRALSRL